jgi:hypothetical protein
MQNAIKISQRVLEFRHDITKILLSDRFEIRKTYGVSKRGTKCFLPPQLSIARLFAATEGIEKSWA